jgi:hypothetical protein
MNVRYRVELSQVASGNGLRNPPEGRARWTLKLPADAMVKLTGHESLSGETVRRRLAENGLKPWSAPKWLRLSRRQSEWN